MARIVLHVCPYILMALCFLGYSSSQDTNGTLPPNAAVQTAVEVKEVRSICCGGVIHERVTTFTSSRSSQMCCGNSTYNADEAICCWNGTFYQLPLPNDSRDGGFTIMSVSMDDKEEDDNNNNNNNNNNITTTNATATIRIRTDLAYLACCADRVFDLRDNVCCQETVLPKLNDARTISCCGRRLYDVLDEICCSGDVIVARNATAADNPSLVQCCGSMPFDPRTHLCCGGRPLPNPDGPDGRCCDGKVYGQRTEVCCAGEIHQRDSPTMVCCGQQPFDWERDRCCDGRVFKSVEKSVECCGNTTYDTEKSKCCHGIVRQLAAANNYSLESRPGQIECCGDVLHDTSFERCCGGVVQANVSLDGDVGCCRTVAFDPSDNLCCNGIVVPSRDKHRACCGTVGKTYDTRQELCCNGRPVMLHRLQESSPATSTNIDGSYKTPPPTNLCCASSAFDPMTQGCCNGLVFTL